MGVFSKAFYDRLAGDATLADLLSIYKGLPAVFTVIPIPDDAELPYIVTEGEVAVTPFDTKTSNGRELIRDIRCYAPAEGSASKIETIAERVRTLFHNHALSINGFDNAMLCEASGPVNVPEENVYGRIVTIRLISMEA